MNQKQNPLLPYKKELQIIKEKGFYVRRYLTIGKFIIDSLVIFFLSFGCFGISFASIWVIFSSSEYLSDLLIRYHNFHIYISFIAPLILLVQYLYMYLFFGNLFFFKDKAIIYGDIYNLDDKIKERVFIRILKGFVFKFWNKGDIRPDVNVFQQSISWILTYVSIFTMIIVFTDIIVYILPFFILFFLSIIFVFVFGKIIESFNPLYAFGNIGEKIQKLTPTIESQSKTIKENFQKDMNFRILSEGFDTLSSTFSEIVSLVIKLEQVEKKANKGNLFDSEQYINSLRGDIVKPLKSLKIFLEGQREKLLESQKELQKVQVRVGGNTELTSESELTSKRGESLLVELDENISKLEEMISKMS